MKSSMVLSAYSLKIQAQQTEINRHTRRSVAALRNVPQHRLASDLSRCINSFWKSLSKRGCCPYSTQTKDQTWICTPSEAVSLWRVSSVKRKIRPRLFRQLFVDNAHESSDLATHSIRGRPL